jgi:hypothetical protein
MALAPGGATAGGAAPLLPDLDQRPPSQIALMTEGGRALLVFASAIDNVGPGSLVVVGRRPTRAAPVMTAHQLLTAADGRRTVRHDVGRLRYVRSPDHSHWHLLDVDRFELRRADGGETLVRDRKSGFCLGDRYRFAPAPAPAAFRSRCGLRRPDLLGLRQGITPGYGDDYAPYLEGQSLDVTAVRPGRYLLVHRANPEGRLAERTLANNAASALLRLWRSGGAARVTVLRTCPDTLRCPGG